MSAPPYMKLYVGDYLGDTHHLGVLEHGAYLLLLMAMWRAGGSLPAADANLAKLARCTPEQWAEVRNVVLPYFQRSRSRLTHKRLAAELSKYDAVSDRRSEAGKRGAVEKARKNNEQAQAIACEEKSNCTHNQNHNQNHSSSEDKSSGAESADAKVVEIKPQPEAPDLNAEAWRLGVAVLVSQGGLSEKSARIYFGGLLKGVQAKDLMPAISQAALGATKDPQGYLYAAAQRLKGRRGSPAIEPQRVGFV